MTDREYKSLKLNFNGGCDLQTNKKIKAVLQFSNLNTEIEEDSQALTLLIETSIKNPTVEKIESLYKILRKFLQLNDKLFELPLIYQYFISQDFIEAKVLKTQTGVSVKIETKNKFETQMNEFIQNIKWHGLKDLIGQKDHDLLFQLDCTFDFNELITNYCSDLAENSLAYHLFLQNQMLLLLTNNQGINQMIDKLIKTMYEGYSFPFFSFSNESDIEMDLDYINEYDKLLLWHESDPNPAFFKYIDFFVDQIIQYFNSLSDEDKNRINDFIDFLINIELAEPPKIVFMLEGICEFELRILMNGLLNLIKFLTFHPSLSDKVKIKAYKKDYLERQTKQADGS